MRKLCAKTTGHKRAGTQQVAESGVTQAVGAPRELNTRPGMPQYVPPEILLRLLERQNLPERSPPNIALAAASALPVPARRPSGRLRTGSHPVSPRPAKRPPTDVIRLATAAAPRTDRRIPCSTRIP